ncbi:DNA topoisomerase 1 [Micractinium conductrix]|uniref:DNA topoisomerase I n=1 Tax=Micractinium conductrix TaxID=554055 RepID=A0A2P6V7D4_9CHLO|nr:DNA topoisomerase 1 [Micractinium conductrix]|eukprot:PSC70005.1 DNA topoisomerase 1 [Micractinium conductrix]
MAPVRARLRCLSVAGDGNAVQLDLALVEEQVSVQLQLTEEGGDAAVAATLAVQQIETPLCVRGSEAGPADAATQGGGSPTEPEAEAEAEAEALRRQHAELLRENEWLQSLVRQHLDGISKASRKSLQEAGRAVSEDEEQRYLLALQQLSRLVAQREAAAEAAKAALVPERARAMAATAAASTQRAALRSFVSDVSAAAARAAAAGQVRAALPDRAVRHFLAADAAAVEDGRMLRAGCARLTHQLAAAERRLKEADQLSAEGLHLVDFEQTRIENAALAAKREARGAEVEKLRGKLVTTVQITAHVQEKLHFCEQDRQARAAALESAEAALGEARAELTAAKAARERARRERSDLTQDWRLVSDPLCVEDMGAQQQRLAQLQAQAAELAARGNCAAPHANGAGRPPSAAGAGTAATNGAAATKPTAGAAHLHGRQVVSDSDSDDDAPLAARKPAAPAPAPAKHAAAVAPAKPAAKPAAGGNGAGPSKPAAPPASKPLIPKRPKLLDDAVELPLAPPKPKPKPQLPQPKPAAAAAGSGSDSDDDQPLIKRKAGKPVSSAKKPVVKKVKAEGGSSAKPKVERKRKPRESSAGGSPERSSKRAKGGGTGKKMWDSLGHAGVLFPPEYESHGVKMLYDGVPVDLTAEQEEVASFFAVMKETDYMNKPTFLHNFWEGFKEVLGPNHVIKKLDKCDFTPIYEWHMAEREKKKQLSKEEKEAAKRERDEKETKYKFAMVDGRKEQVGNFRVEPPGLFRGRGEHPKMGRIKKRIYPRDITINIGEGEPVPAHPFPGQSWKEVRHDKTVTWLAYWRDPVNTKEYKYVFLAANSTWKAESDQQKYEKARKLKDKIDDIRTTYTKNWEARDRAERQMATALYFIDKLALRAGHEKDEDEADTVGCCTLKVENVECVAPHSIKFDFLGKDSIRYENTVEVEKKVFDNIALFMRENASGKPKKEGDQLFECFDAQDLNVRLKELMDGLSVKVFRTYNASVTLDRLLADESLESTVDGKQAEYNRANKEVAILCNHQRSVPKGHEGQMEKMKEKLTALHDEIHELQGYLKLFKAGKEAKDKDGKVVKEDSVRRKLDQKKVQLEKMQINAAVKEDLKTVALGTSKINYLDPRITVAWCKRNEVPIERVFNKSLLTKFLWSMDCEPEFRF